MSQATPPPPPLQSLQTVLEGTAPTTSSPPRHSSSSSFKTLSPSLLIIFLILVITVAASISLCLLLRHLNRRCLRHITPSSSASTSAAISDSRRLSSRRVSPETLPTSVSSLPLFTFSSITRRSSTTVAADCAVCLSKFDPDDQLRLLPLCCHAFHALCVDTWLQSHQTCPLCRSPIYASDSELMTLVANAANSGVGNGGSFRLEIGNVSRRRETALSNSGDAQQRRSYSIGSFDYLVDDDSEVHLSNAHRRNGSDYKDDAVVTVIAEAPPPLPPSETNLSADVASGGRSWLKDYIDRLSNSLSSRELSFRSSGRFFTGSSRRSEASSTGDWNLEAGRVGEEITEMFRWLSGV